jgi:hypothetical protein
MAGNTFNVSTGRAFETRARPRDIHQINDFLAARRKVMIIATVAIWAHIQYMEHIAKLSGLQGCN